MSAETAIAPTKLNFRTAAASLAVIVPTVNFQRERFLKVLLPAALKISRGMRSAYIGEESRRPKTIVPGRQKAAGGMLPSDGPMPGDAYLA
ncbi:hypothetical protein [Paeniglutamicibacter cryotolerans]|uniref:Uncharacterized protein n=1 Tax=Paeniglutamicibacter cryotolerans TaxID=670079 RepID=A0A839QI98_9MICC|nr:hypothetical protein [Paeniglutamicibacter cryotolerans]MBB2995590.1 hypothetical protein [Paeniglutamicibacter cryotolerans]